MATILFQAAGAALGGVFGPVGAIFGRAAGALAGSMVDRALIGGRTVSGARLATARIPGADDGTPVSCLYGTARIAGTLIWATRFEEEATSERTGAKGGGARRESFRYFANLAVGLCEGPAAHIRRVWADGRELDLTALQMRFYSGTEDQQPDPLIEAKQGAGNAPAYRGLCYVVLERLPLDPFGNRIPVLQFEVIKPVGQLERQIRAITLIPGATEHGYSLQQVSESTGAGSARILNRNTLTATTDMEAALDELVALCPALESVALVVSWFGTDLRAGECRIVPGVETNNREAESAPWSVCGIGREDAYRISLIDGKPAYGGTPDDRSVIAAIAALKARGLKVFLYPFIMMDVPPANDLPDPWGEVEQQPFPWRGRITCHPAPGRSGSPDRTSAAGVAVDAFTGTAQAVDFTISADGVAFSGTDEGYRRLVLHYAHLATLAGGVDGMIIGSELRGLTQIRDGSGGFPFVRHLVQLAQDVRAVTGPATKLTYGADWSEYFGYHPQDGSGDVFFHLDPLWASPAIDAVGIDNYMPLSDWRDGDRISGNPDGFTTAADLAAMTAAIGAGEGYDWYYANEADRDRRIRTPVTDGLAGKPWVFRYKDLHGWWSNRHFDRVNGAERAGPTAWMPGMKPLWFTELGCPAIDKGGNQPNVFVDPKSSESALPYYSAGSRSDAVQRRFLEAHHRWWKGSGAPAGMVDPAHIFVWTFDARPFPAFPRQLSVWSDGHNWTTGHWLNGRLGAGTLADVIAAVLTDHGFADFDVSAVTGDLTGYIQAGVESARNLLEPLLEAFRIDVIEDGALLRFRSRGEVVSAARRIDVLAERENEPAWREIRGHESDFATSVVLTSYDQARDYEQAGVRSRQIDGGGNRVMRLDLAAVLPAETALAATESALRDHRAARRTLFFELPPTDIGLQPGDCVTLRDGPAGRFLISRIEDGETRRMEAREFALSTAPARPGEDGAGAGRGAGSDAFAPALLFMDLPRFRAGEGTDFACVAAVARPWRRMAVSSSVTSQGYAHRATIERPARMGVLASPLPPGMAGRIQHAHSLEVVMHYGALSSAARLEVLNGTNLMAIRSAAGEFEILSFTDAQEIAGGQWRLTGLLRGLAGSTRAMEAGALAGASAVMLDDAVVPLGLTTAERGLALNWLVSSATGGDTAGPHVFAGGTVTGTPLPPVHIRANRLDNGDIDISWIRCGRIDADDWEAVDIPLDEQQERYRLEISVAGTVVRTVTVHQSRFVYHAADLAADVPVTSTSFDLAISQMGRVVAAGAAARASVTL